MSQFFKILLVMCLVGFVCKVILTWEVVKLISFCSERELGVYKLGEMYPEWKPVYLHAKRKSKIYSMCAQFLLNFALIRAVYFNLLERCRPKKVPFYIFYGLSIDRILERTWKVEAWASPAAKPFFFIFLLTFSCKKTAFQITE